MTVSAEDQPYRHLAHKLAPGAMLKRTWQLAGGISAMMTALELAYPDGRTLRMIVRRPSTATLKRDPHAAANEYNMLELAQSLGLRTQAPLLLDRNGTIFPAPYLVLEYIDGEPQFAPADTRAMMRQLARQLAAIHHAEYARFDVSFLHVQAAGDPGASPARLNRSLDEARIRAALGAVRPLRRNAPALLHGDYWPGNILWRDGILAAVIDWEDAMLGDPLADLAIARLELVWIFGVDAMDTFTEHYRACISIDYSDLAYWDLVAALRFVRLAGADLAAWAAFFEPFGRPDITEQSIRAHYSYFTAQAFTQLMV